MQFETKFNAKFQTNFKTEAESSRLKPRSGRVVRGKGAREKRFFAAADAGKSAQESKAFPRPWSSAAGLPKGEQAAIDRIWREGRLQDLRDAVTSGKAPPAHWAKPGPMSKAQMKRLSFFCRRCGESVVVRYLVAMRDPCRYCGTFSWSGRAGDKDLPPPGGGDTKQVWGLTPLPKAALVGPVPAKALATASQPLHAEAVTCAKSSQPKKTGVILRLLQQADADLAPPASGVAVLLKPVPKKELKSSVKSSSRDAEGKPNDESVMQVDSTYEMSSLVGMKFGHLTFI